MAEISAKKRIWGWFFFDWASQPYNTLLLTFIFAPYVKDLIGDPDEAQSTWGYVVGSAGLVIAIIAPILGAMADTSGRRVRWVWLFSLLYVVGAFGLWWAIPGAGNLMTIFLFFAIGLIGMEFATIFTNSMLPDLGSREEMGAISGNGWAFGYVGGLLALVIMLVFLAESPETGKTVAGFDPIFGLDPATREGTRAVGPLAAIWYAVFMVPFFLWVRDPRMGTPPKGAIKEALGGLWRTVRNLPRTPSLFAYLASSMFYRDALNGMYVFGGIYAAGTLDWSVVQTGIFGILAIIMGAIFAFLGGRADTVFGPKPVIVVCVVILTLVAITVATISRESVLGFPVDPSGNAADFAFYAVGAVIGAAGGVIQAASRTMMVRQANPERMTEAFGLYALAGKSTSFVAPFAIGVATTLTGSQNLGVTPLIGLFLIGLILLIWVKPDGGERP
ncbi:MFS transporter [Vannielia sp.]|uniref:MFS transporter n=1 Tax=Vannielia sp. TaxID=2813045 RepID=UPI002614093C|nr:MFS transporter [Vannielia sp.]MDF1872740.1 MFS transporter [Vannielia sp.]